jgi:6-phosphogluconolactonase
MTQFIYIGTYTHTNANLPHRKEGIYIFRIDPTNGALQLTATVEDVLNPSFLAIHPTKHFLYAVNELGEGFVSAFRVDSETGSLELINRQPTKGSAPCYTSIDPTGRFVLVSNYGNGTLSVFPIQNNGGVEPLSDYVIHTGKGPDRLRQEAAHAHSIIPDPSGNFILAADLGIDEVLVYRLDSQNGKLIPNQPPSLPLLPGSGPRHMAFHPNGTTLYIASELGNTVTACTWDSQRGILDSFQTLPTVPIDFTGTSYVADIHITPSGDYLYISNRGHHSLAIFRVMDDGSLTVNGHSSSGGQWPRNFAILPSGDRVVVANEHSENLLVYHINPSNGQLKATGFEYSVPKPVCVLPVTF